MDKNNFQKLYYNIIVISIISTIIYIFGLNINRMVQPIDSLNQDLSLDIINLPLYSSQTIVRFCIAMILSIIVSIIYATIAAKNVRMQRILIPLLDLFQSIPVLGYLSFTVTAFINLTPNNILGLELAAIFAILTSQVWNMIFSIYQSLTTIPKDLFEVANIFKLNKWQIFWRIELPFALPGLISNIILSMASSWFFVVAQEIISVGVHQYKLPGMGQYITLALQNMDVLAIIYAAITIGCIIFVFNEIIFKPLISWSSKFRYEFNSCSVSNPNSWMLNYLNLSIVPKIFLPIKFILAKIYNLKFCNKTHNIFSFLCKVLEIFWWVFLIWAIFVLSKKFYIICLNNLSLHEVFYVIKAASITLIRIVILLALCSIIWVPIGIFIGLRSNLSKNIQPIIQFLTAIPANLYYPLFVILISTLHLNCEIWLSLMIIIGSQWYILYNVIGGAQNIPNELLEASKIFKIRFSDKLFKIFFPAISPYYITGLITAAGASWNASIIAEIINWGNVTLKTTGIGSYITINTNEGNFMSIALGLIVMSSFVIILNYLLWKPLFKFVSTRFILE